MNTSIIALLLTGGLSFLSAPGLSFVPMSVNTAQTGSESLTVQYNFGMQELGATYEDAMTGQLYVLPTSNPQVTAHSLFVQGSK